MKAFGADQRLAYAVQIENWSTLDESVKLTISNLNQFFNPHPVFTPLVGVKCIQIIFDSLCHALKLLPLIEEFITAHFINSLPVRCGFRGAKPERTGHRYRKNLHLTGKLLLRCDKFSNKFINIQRKCPFSRRPDRFFRPNVGSLNFTF